MRETQFPNSQDNRQENVTVRVVLRELLAKFHRHFLCGSKSEEHEGSTVAKAYYHPQTNSYICVSCAKYCVEGTELVPVDQDDLVNACEDELDACVICEVPCIYTDITMRERAEHGE